MSAAFSAIMITGDAVFPETILGMIEASTIRSPFNPCTCRFAPTTVHGPEPITPVPGQRRARKIDRELLVVPTDQGVNAPVRALATWQSRPPKHQARHRHHVLPRSFPTKGPKR